MMGFQREYAPTYHIELRERPALVWDFNSLLLYAYRWCFHLCWPMTIPDWRYVNTAVRHLLPQDQTWNSALLNARIITMYIKAGRRKMIHQHMRSDYMRNSSIIMYTTEDGLTKIETTFDEDTVWLSLEQMSELFQRDKSTYLKAYQKYIWRMWITKKFSCCKFCNNCLWRKNISGRLLQPWCHYLRRLWVKISGRRLRDSLPFSAGFTPFGFRKYPCHIF